MAKRQQKQRRLTERGSGISTEAVYSTADSGSTSDLDSPRTTRERRAGSRRDLQAIIPMFEYTDDDLDSDRPVKRTRLSLGRAVTNAPLIEDEDSDDTPAADEPGEVDTPAIEEAEDALDPSIEAAEEVATPPAEAVEEVNGLPVEGPKRAGSAVIEELDEAGGVAIVATNMSTDDDGDDVLTDLDDVDIALLAPSPKRHQPAPLRRGGKRQRGGKSRYMNGTIGRGRLPGTPGRDSNRDESMPRGSPAGTETHGILDRLPGRRRAHHADMDIEVDLRRQLELRIAYRALAKALKPILAELADRTAQEQRTNEELYKQCPEYQEVLDDLQERLDARMALLQAEYYEEEQRLQRMHKADEQNVYAHYEQARADIRDDTLLACQYQFLKTLHEAGIEQRQIDQTAMQQQGVVPPYKLQLSAPRNITSIDQEQMRRHYLTNTSQNWENLEDRFRVALAQCEHDPNSFAILTEADAITEEDQLIAEEREDTAALLQVILDAAAGAQVKSQHQHYQIIPNSAAFGLNVLADAMLLTPPEVATKDVYKQMAEKPSLQQEAQVKHRNTVSLLSSPRSSTVRSPSITPRSQAFVPTISALINDGEPNNQHPPRTDVPQSPRSSTSNKVVDEIHQVPHKKLASEVQPVPRAQTPAVVIEPLNAPARQAMASQTPGTTTRQDQHPQENKVVPMNDTQGVAEQQKRVRRRPGPRAIYTKQTAPDIVPPSQQYWSPFSNSMGPPTYMPKYVRDEVLMHRSSTSEGPEALYRQEQEAGNHQEPNAILPRTMHEAPRETRRDASESLASKSVTSPSISQQHHHRVPSNREPSRPIERRRSSRSLHPDQPSRQSTTVPTAAQSSYHWPHQNIYYQPQTFYRPYSPAPVPQPHSIPPPLPPPAAPHHAYGPHPSAPAPVPRYPPPPAAYPPWPPYPHAAPPPAAPFQDSGPHNKPRQSSSEHPRERRQSSTTLPSIASMIPVPPHHPGGYPYGVPHAWPHPSDPPRQYGTAPLPQDHGRHLPPPYYPSSASTEEPPRRGSHVPLLTPSSKPLPSYVQGSATDRKRSAELAQERSAFPKEHGMHEQAQPQPHLQNQAQTRAPSQSQPAYHSQAPPLSQGPVQPQIPPQAQARQYSKDPTNGESAAAKSDLPNQTQPRRQASQPGPGASVVPTPKPSNARASSGGSTAPAASTPSVQPAPIQHPTFKGQRPKHHEWRNWTSAVPPPSSGTANSSSTAPASVMIIGGSNGPGSYSNGTRKRKSKAAKASTPQPGTEVAASASPAQELQVHAPATTQQMANPWHREFRFESQNKKFEGQQG